MQSLHSPSVRVYVPKEPDAAPKIEGEIILIRPRQYGDTQVMIVWEVDSQRFTETN